MIQVLNLKNYSFNIFSVPYFIIGVFFVFQAIRVYRRRKVSRVGISFVALMVSISTWMIANALSFSSRYHSVGLFWQKICWIGVVELAPSAYFFITSVIEVKRNKTSLALYLISLPLLLSIPFNLLISGVEKFYWGYDSVGGRFETIFLVYFGIVMLLTLLEQVWVLKRKDITERKRKLTKNIFISVIIALTSVWDFLPLFGMKMYPIGFIPFTIWAVYVSKIIRKFDYFNITPEIAAKSVINTMPDMLFVCDASGTIKIVNSAAERIVAGNKEDLVGQNIDKFIPITEKIIKKAVGEKFKQQKLVGKLTNINRLSGKKLSISISFAEIEDNQGETLGLVFICHDVSKLQRARREKEEALKMVKKNENRLSQQLKETKKTKKAMLNVLEDLNKEKKKLEHASAKDEAVLLAIGDGLVVVDDQGKIVMVNKAFENMLGWKSDEVVGKMLTKIVPMENEQGEKVSKKDRLRPLVLIPGKNISETRTSYYSTTETYYFVRKNGSRFPVVVTSTPIVLDKKIIGGVEVFRDVTKEKEIDKAKTEFVSLASHQLRTPLATVNWYSEVLLNEKIGDLNTKQKEYMKEINRGNRRMIYLVNALLNVSRIELGTFKINPEEIDIREVVKEILKDVKPKVDKKKLEIITKYEKNLPTLKCDKNLMTIILENLITNAVKYTPQEGKIEIKLFSTKKKFTIVVKDNGIGIPKKQQSKIFSKLFRADNVKKLETDGTGLGLYIVKSVLDKSGGKIEFKSQKGKGTEFKITFPKGGMKKRKGMRKLSRIEK